MRYEVVVCVLFTPTSRRVVCRRAERLLQVRVSTVQEGVVWSLGRSDADGEQPSVCAQPSTTADAA